MPVEFRVASLASGSSGNAFYAESPDGAVLIDAGVSGTRIVKGTQKIGGHIDRVDGVVLGHDHSDHVRGAGVLSRKHGIPLLMTQGTHDVIRPQLFKAAPPRLFQAGSIIAAGGFHIHTLSTPHDGRDPVCFVLERANLRCGILTDLGYVTKELKELFSTLDVVFLESNYDPHMLEHGPYHAALKLRIRGPGGHIANEEAAELVRDWAGDRLQVVVLSHLSETNNAPDTARRCMQVEAAERLVEQGIQVYVAPRHDPGPVVMVSSRD